MKLNAGIITSRLEETKEFYLDVLNFGISFENDFYLLLHTPDETAQLAFLLPGPPTQQPVFHPAFSGKGVFLTLEVKDVDQVYERIKNLPVNIEVDIRDEPWDDRHFAFYDPNGVAIDVVKYTRPE